MHVNMVIDVDTGVHNSRQYYVASLFTKIKTEKKYVGKRGD